MTKGISVGQQSTVILEIDGELEKVKYLAVDYTLHTLEVNCFVDGFMWMKFVCCIACSPVLDTLLFGHPANPEVAVHWAGLVLGWVIACRQINHFGM